MSRVHSQTHTEKRFMLVHVAVTGTIQFHLSPCLLVLHGHLVQHFASASCNFEDPAKPSPSTVRTGQPVNATCRPFLSRNSVLNCLTLHPFSWYNCLIRLLSLSLKAMFTNNAITSYDVWDVIFSIQTSDCQNK